MSKDSADPSTFAEELHSLVKQSLPIFRYAFAGEVSLLVLSVVLLLLLDGESASYYVVLLNIVILLLVLLPTGAVLYFVDPSDENQRDIIS